MSTKSGEVCLFLDRTMKLAVATGMMTKKRGWGVGECVKGQRDREWAGVFWLGGSLGRPLPKLMASVYHSPTCWLAVPSRTLEAKSQGVCERYVTKQLNLDVTLDLRTQAPPLCLLLLFASRPTW